METIVNLLPWMQIILSVILVVLILVQQSEAGLGAAFGGGDAGGAGNFSRKRGFEKTIFITTIIVALIWVGIAIIALFI
ncbi:MAG: preprotein translocase subunit SecG [Candidatus Paceibacterota bacterium]